MGPDDGAAQHDIVAPAGYLSGLDSRQFAGLARFESQRESNRVVEEQVAVGE
jgi:hypothetical protein